MTDSTIKYAMGLNILNRLMIFLKFIIDTTFRCNQFQQFLLFISIYRYILVIGIQFIICNIFILLLENRGQDGIRYDVVISGGGNMKVNFVSRIRF